MNTGVQEIDNNDADYIVGSDECGVGAWAGPLVVCAALISKNWPLSSIVCDSKELKTEAAREKTCKQIIGSVLYSCVTIQHEEVDRVGIYKAIPPAHEQAIAQVLKKHEDTGCVGKILVVADGNRIIQGAISLPQADALVPAVSAASIIGKVFRDRLMVKLAQKYPGYAFERNKGYGGNAAHDAGLSKLGPCAIHRRSFGPIAALLKNDDTPRNAWELPE